MIKHRPFDALGRIDRDWLQAKLHFRIGTIGPAEHAPLGALHVWNDDTFAPHSGFGMHAHENVEIITVVHSGAISHEDDFGNKARIAAGDVQVMSAGKGVRHAERNEQDEATLLFQIWLTPRSRNVQPRWATRRFDTVDAEGRFAVLASGDQADVDAGALAIDADARLMRATLRAGHSLAHRVAAGCIGYLVTTTGCVRVNDVDLETRDGAAIVSESALTVTAINDTSVLMVEVRAESGVGR